MHSWEFITASPEGVPVIIEGVDVWKHEWVKSKEPRAVVKDPRYGRELSFNVYSISAGTKTVTFAAGEFSNGIFGFFQKKA